MPPGPMPLPLIGNLLQVDTRNVLKSFLKLSKKYGPVYTIHLGPRRVVVLCGYQAVKEALLDQDEEFGGRGEQATFDWLFQGYGVAFTNGERARQMRRFSIMTLRNFGVGKKGIEERILDEAQYLLGVLRDTKGLPFDLTYILSRTVSNVISSIIFGDRFDYEDKEFHSLLYMMLESLRFTSTSWGQLYDMFPGIMNYLPGPQHKALKLLAGLEKYMEKKVKANEETLDPNSPRDFIDCFLIKMHQVLGGGLQRSTNVSAEKIHEEIDRVIGRNRSPRIEDRSRMPYTDAVIHECQRFCDILPLGVSRRTTTQTHFRGYTIPQMAGKLGKHLVMVPCSYWDVKKALLDQGEEFGGHLRLALQGLWCDLHQRGAGKRYCFGEMLARMELFLFVTSILQHFRFESPIDCQDLDISPKLMQGRSKMPPGPMPLPLVGNLLHVGTKNVFKALMKLSKKYGPIYTIQLGTRRVVVLCGYRAVKEALLDQGEEFGGRGKQATFDFLFKGYGVAFSNGERARQLRRFSITTLRNFGVGKRSIEERILDEAQYLLGALHDTKGLPFDPTYILSRSVSNVISSVLFGDRFDYEDKEFLSLLYMVLETFRFTSTSWGQLYDMFPGIMNYLPGPQHKSFKLLAGLEKYMEKKVKANEETLDPNSPRDFIDCFLIKMHQRSTNVSAEKIHQEIDQVIGRNRSPSIEDRSCMPYTDAVIHECQRFCNILPLGLSRQTTKDTQFCGYNIPQV
ncbi:cytochrome P450 2A13-like [Alligator mississippiensis]|uniref:Cytochrome P450 2A13-like n=1 Tax=Alligator mississippiensis TaxID=8496 RepID=A0A151MW41_ALLMI|nr:cytochrome P450 2A13-like [Alligator mississippiensis]